MRRSSAALLLAAALAGGGKLDLRNADCEGRRGFGGVS
jgi:hypothetical protein